MANTGPLTATPAWIAPFYDRKSLAAGPSGVLDHHRERAASIERLAGVAGGRVLELGAGAGGAAAAAAQLGHQVTAVELSAVRAAYARELADEVGAGLRVVEGDFMTAPLGGPFDVVVMWNGFGVGDDAFQRALLRRAVDEWLGPDGRVVLDVYNPAAWARWAGETEVDEETGLRQRVDLDAVESRLVDAWWFDGEDGQPLAQDVRCYSLADLRLLLEPTGLEVERVEHQDRAAETDPMASGPLGEAWGYRVVLRRSVPPSTGPA